MPQALAVGEALERAMDRRAADGLPEQEFGHVVTIMGGRLDDWLKKWAGKNRILTTPGALDWAGVAALKRAHAIFTERGYRSRILSAAFRSHLHWADSSSAATSSSRRCSTGSCASTRTASRRSRASIAR